MNTIENWLMNVALGKAVARVAIVIAAYISGPVVQGLAAKAGISVAVDPVKLQAELLSLCLIAFELFKARRAANPNSPTVQTDSSKPGAVLPPAP